MNSSQFKYKQGQPIYTDFIRCLVPPQGYQGQDTGMGTDVGGTRSGTGYQTGQTGTLHTGSDSDYQSGQTSNLQTGSASGDCKIFICLKTMSHVKLNGNAETAVHQSACLNAIQARKCSCDN